MSASTGSRLRTPSNLIFHPSQVSKLSPCSLGAISRQANARMAIITTNVVASRSPGRRPAMYSRPIDSSASTPYRIRPMLGGISMPSVPPAAREPTTMRSE